ncbi:MAG: hypothetical protein ABSE62_03670 [Chthoniobacteraceae bacterium]|jgi:hypothetical protein
MSEAEEVDLSPPVAEGNLVRNHSAFLSGYAPEDENLYDDTEVS